ncbi:MAG: carbonic anhydrase [Deltaproteobacteria bacterium]|nr:carbonic anhydrase [Deltaproteobacteria bacterium]
MPNVKPLPARQALARLIHGNARFAKWRRAGKMPAPKDASWFQVKERGPFAIILSCSDSRAPAEILFDQGLGDLFVIRVAGNIVAPSQVGSVEFAAATTKARLVVVMGHSQCGAIDVTLKAMEGKEPVPSENIQSIVSRIRPHIERMVAADKRARKKRDEIWRDAVRANVSASTDHLRHGSRFLEELVREGKLVIVGAKYCLDTGLVDFFDNPIADPVRKKAKRRKR